MTMSLFSPIKIGRLELENRIAVSPMCQYSANDGCASDWHTTHLGTLAGSGASLLVVEATGVERRGRITHGCLGLYSDDCEAALASVVAHCRRIGSAKLGIQLAHAGRKASTQRPWEGGTVLKDQDPWPTIAPSAVPFGPDWPVPKEATIADLDEVREAFVSATKRAVRIGFDAIELHMAHGYLLHSFMSPLSNKRTDQYGGSFENRMRFPLEITRAVRAAVPASCPLGARITGSDWAAEGGLTPDDAVNIAKSLKDAGLDFVCVSSGAIAADIRMNIGPGYQLPFAEKVRRESGIVTRAVGLIATPQQANAVIENGQADMVALGRAFLDNPHWGWHAAHVLNAEVKRPVQYARAAPKFWPGAKY